MHDENIASKLVGGCAHRKKFALRLPLLPSPQGLWEKFLCVRCIKCQFLTSPYLWIFVPRQLAVRRYGKHVKASRLFRSRREFCNGPCTEPSSVSWCGVMCQAFCSHFWAKANFIWQQHTTGRHRWWNRATDLQCSCAHHKLYNARYRPVRQITHTSTNGLHLLELFFVWWVGLVLRQSVGIGGNSFKFLRRGLRPSACGDSLSLPAEVFKLRSSGSGLSASLSSC